MATALIYSRPSDEVGHSATCTLSTATADAKYPVTNVQDRNPAKPFLTSSSSTAVEIDFDHGSATDVQIVSLHGYNIPAGTDVRLQRGATQGATTMDAAVTIPAYAEDGLPWPVGVDLTGVSGYGSYRWTRLHVPSLGQKVGIGAICLWSTKRTDLTNVQYPVSDSEQHVSRVFQTAYGVRKAQALGVRLRTSPAQFFLRDAGIASFLSLQRDCKANVNAWLFWRDPNGSDAWLSAFDVDTLNYQLPWNTSHTLQTTIVELSCGVAIPTS